MRLLLICALMMPLLGCRGAYYNVMEKFGREKRDILVKRVEAARDEQSKAKEEFKTTYQKFQELSNFQGGELESKYKKLSSAYDDAQGRADAVHKKVQSVDQVAGDLFKEWQQELKQYQNQDLRRTSERELNDTRSRYRQLITVMRNSESKMDPVLRAFRDQVLFLKHNLNAQAISSLQVTASGIEQDVQNLIRDMEASINEANTFITQMRSEK